MVIDLPENYMGPGWHHLYEDGSIEWAGFTKEQALGLED